jgi:tryptophanyl-tRNA synthetase
VEGLNSMLDPLRARWKHYHQRPDDVLDVLREGTRRANLVAEETLELAKRAMKQDYFTRRVSIE